MPPLRHPSEHHSIRLPQRSARVAAETDVLVVGGGPAGVGAALGAASAGARVVLTERYGFLGGSATAALVAPLASYHTSMPAPTKPGSPTLYPTDHGPGEAAISGALQTLVERLVQAGGALPPSPHTGFVVPFDAETFKAVTFDLLDEAGVDVLLHSFASGVVGESRPEGVVLETKSGPLVVLARAVVDATGDGDVATMSGALYEMGRRDGLVQPMTLIFRMANFDMEAFRRYVEENPGQFFGVYGLWDLVWKAREDGRLDLPREDLLLFATPRPEDVTVNGTRVSRVLGTDVWDLTYAEWAGRRQMRAIEAFMRTAVPGFERAYAAASGCQIGVRETRRVLGEYVLTADDVLGAAKFHDVVARNTYPLDIHDPDGRGTTLRRLPPGEAYDIPLRCLLPRGVDGLLVAGRCLSATHEALSSARVMPACMATGQAAGVCAALSTRQGVLPRHLPYRSVQEELVRQGADLHGAV